LKKLEEDNLITITEQYISLINITPSLPIKWERKLKDAENQLIYQGVNVDKWTNLIEPYHLPPDLQNEFYYYLLQTNKALMFDEDRLNSTIATKNALKKLLNNTMGENF